MVSAEMIREYSDKLQQLHDGSLSEQEWMDYCKAILEAVMEANKDVYIRLKERED
jgi:hypothetical protein